VRFREARLPGETSLGLDRETSPDTSDRLDPLLNTEYRRVLFPVTRRPYLDPMTTGIHMIDPSAPPESPASSPEKSAVMLDGDEIIIEHLIVTDPSVVGMVATAGYDDRADLLRRIMSVGVQGVASMGIGIDLTAIDARVHRVLESVTTEAEATVRTIIDESRSSLSKQFDPEQRSSILARALADFTAWRDEFLDGLDPGIEGSAATMLIQRLLDLVGPDGALERRLAAALDMDEGDSAFARLSRLIDERFDDLRHGLEFEDVVEVNLRRWASTSKGTIVERTSTIVGALTASSKVGDFVVTLGDGRRIVVEAKRHASITLGGSGGILGELDAAMTNRRADAAVCIAGRDAFPAEVGRFNVYGDRVLAVDEGDGAMTSIAMHPQGGRNTERGAPFSDDDHRITRQAPRNPRRAPPRCSRSGRRP